MLKNIFFIALSIITFQVSASENITCNTCENQPDFYNVMVEKAEYEVVATGYTADIYVANIKQAKVYGWRVNASYYNSSNGELAIRVVASTLNIPNDMQNAVNNASNTDLFRLAKNYIAVPVDSGLSSAWDIARNSSNRSALDDWFNNAHPVEYWLSTLGSATGGLFLDPLKNLEYIFKFEDGSTVIMVAPSFGQAILKLSYKANSAQDIDNNTITDTGLGFAGEYDFTTTGAMQNFLNQASLYGIEVVRITTTITGGTTRYRAVIRDLQ